MIFARVTPDMAFPGLYSDDRQIGDTTHDGKREKPFNAYSTNSPEDVSFRHHGFYASKRHHGYPSVTCVNSDMHKFHVGDKLIELRGMDTKAMKQRDIDAVLISQDTCAFVICSAVELSRRRKRVENMSEEQIERQRERKRDRAEKMSEEQKELQKSRKRVAGVSPCESLSLPISSP